MSQTSKTMDLLHRLGSDVSKLRNEVGSLLSKKEHALSENARDLAERGKKQLLDGREFAAAHLRYLKEHPTQSTAGLAGGLLLLGAVGIGIYYICKSGCPACKKTAIRDDNPYQSESPEENLPPYIS